MLAKMGHILNISAVLGVSAFAAHAEGRNYLSGNVYAPPAVCAALAKGGPMHEAMSGQTGFVLAWPDYGPGFMSLDAPGLCRIGDPIAAPLFGRGSDLYTIMVPVSCIDDGAVPGFSLLVLEFDGDEASGRGRVNVYPVGQPDDRAAGLVGEYVTCMDGGDSLLQDAYIRGGMGPG